MQNALHKTPFNCREQNVLEVDKRLWVMGLEWLDELASIHLNIGFKDSVIVNELSLHRFVQLNLDPEKLTLLEPVVNKK